MVPAAGASVLGRSAFVVVAGVESGRGEYPRSAESLGAGWPSRTREQDSIASRSVSSLPTSVLTTSGSPEQKRSARAPNQERSKFTMTNKFAMVLKVTPWRRMKRRWA